MGSSDSGTGVVDCSIGSIVWVRRRNGSWWPGKILGSDELSASHVMSPRSGTPVKLLGREDASVDWYNLEKSKRVKAFRCGEFDDCIERAEASQGMPPKKREKYARREDAILHALELERQTLEKKYGKVVGCSTGVRNRSRNGVNGETMISSESLEIGNGRHLQSETHLLSKSFSLLLKDEGENQYMLSERVKEENDFCLADDNSGVTPRMRGLRDFGLRIVPSGLKISPLASPKGTHKPSFGGRTQTLPNSGLDPDDMVDAGSENSSDKRKRPLEDFGDDSLAKRCERRLPLLPLLQVLENSSKALVPQSEADVIVNLNSISEDEQPGRSRYTSLQHGDLDQDNVGSTEDTKTDSSETDSLDSDTDDLASLSEGAASIELQPKYPRRSDLKEEQSVSSKELDELALADEISHPCYNDQASTSMGMSRWQLKGKRNTRSLVRRPFDGVDRNFSWASSDETTAFETGIDSRDEPYLIEKNNRPQIARYGSRVPDVISRRSAQWQQSDWNDYQAAFKGHWEDSGNYFHPSFVGRRHFGGRMMLVDVDLKVQAGLSNPRNEVRITAQTSRLNGQSIIGYPIEIEALENGSTESLLVENEGRCPDMLGNETALPQTWRTARRTANIRVPRPTVSSECDESGKHLQFVDARTRRRRSSDAGTSGHKGGGVMERQSTDMPIDRKSSRKPQKKISLSLNQKTRTLSSIACQPRRSMDLRHSGNDYGMDGLKPPECLTTAVACIPVKLVFSRLREELVGRHS